MLTKLTLSVDEDVVAQAKRLAAEQNTSVSAMFSRIVRAMAEQSQSPSDLGPITRQVAGIVKLPKGKSPRDVLTEALVEKHGLKR